jgi:hypothetical protein
MNEWSVSDTSHPNLAKSFLLHTDKTNWQDHNRGQERQGAR